MCGMLIISVPFISTTLHPSCVSLTQRGGVSCKHRIPSLLLHGHYNPALRWLNHPLHSRILCVSVLLSDSQLLKLYSEKESMEHW